MAFKLAIRCPHGEFLEALSREADERSLGLIHCDTHEWLSIESLTEFICEKAPNVIVNVPASGDLLTEAKVTASLGVSLTQVNIPLLQLSTFRVFGSDPNKEFAENSEPQPEDTVGRQWLGLEQALTPIENKILLRVSWMLGGEFENVLIELMRRLIAGEPFYASDHDFGRPVTVKFLSNVILAVVQQVLCGANNWGAFHVRSADKCSEAELCDALVRLISAELKQEVEPPLIAGAKDNRRILSGLALIEGRRLTDNFGIQQPSWRKGLKTRVKATLDSLSKVCEAG